MTEIGLYDYQLDAVRKMKNGCILCGGVGSGKSRTALAYYCESGNSAHKLYIVTTARKRDTKEWEEELSPFLFPVNSEIAIDSWNNIQKYSDIKGAFFIFDEQRVVGNGVWVKTFLKIAKNNRWILLSATPGDTWMDYIPVFIANGFYKNRTEFIRRHVVYKSYSKFPQVERYLETGRLIRLRNSILVNMDFRRETVSHHEDIYASYDISQYKDIVRNRWNIIDDKPIENASEFCYALRHVVNSDLSRQEKVLEIFRDHPKVIIFYNFDYELEILKGLSYGKNVKIAEWNGHRHQAIPVGRRWVYLVQYSAGAEGWNCTETDTVIFYSQNYSYKIMIQASGRIDRLNTPYTDLYYYHLKSRAGIDIAISRALRDKKKFNESAFVQGKQPC